MDFARLPRYHDGRTDGAERTGPESPVVAATLGAVRQVGRSIRAQASFLVLTTAAASVLPAALVAFVDGLNDKPGGFHADAWAYAKVVLVAALAAGLAALVRRAVGRPRTFEAQVFLPVLLGGLAVAAVSLTFCQWGGRVFAHRTNQ